MHEAPAVVDRRICEEPFDRTLAKHLECGVHLAFLLGNVEVYNTLCATSAEYFFQSRWWYGSQAVQRCSNRKLRRGATTQLANQIGDRR